MARASVITLLPLDTWADILGIDPWEFNQFERSAGRKCEHVFFQYPWHQSYLSREEIADAILRAEQQIANKLGWWPAPVYSVDEEITLAQPYARYTVDDGRNVTGWWKGIGLRWRKFIGGGVLNRTVIGDVAVVKSNQDGDSIDETFTLTFATTVTDVNEIGIYFTDTDRNNEPVSEQWRIRPVRVSISAGTATVIGKSWLLVPPDKTLATDAAELTISAAANYVTSLKAMRVFRDNTATAALPYQGVSEWDVPPNDCAGDDCGFQIRPVCLQSRVSGQGIVQLKPDATNNWPYGWQPQRVKVNYLSGQALVEGQLHPTYARAIALLATAHLTGKKCGCDRSDRLIEYWSSIQSVGADAENALLTEELNRSPWGVERGAIEAWRLISDFVEPMGVGIL